MDRTLSGFHACQPEQFIVGDAQTLVGHCVNIRNLGKLAFFTLRTQTWSVQVVCSVKSVIDELRRIDEYSLVEVTGTVQEKHRRCERDQIEHELNAEMLARIGGRTEHSPNTRGDASVSQHFFQSIEKIVQGARLIDAARKVLIKWGVTELPSPDSLQFVDEQALAYLEHQHYSTAPAQRCCLHPPFHVHSRFLASGGLHRFAFFSRGIGYRQLLHVALCGSRPCEMQGVLDDLEAAIFGSDISRLPLRDGRSAALIESRIGVQSVDSVEQQATNHRGWVVEQCGGDARAAADTISTDRDRRLYLGFGLSERAIFYRNGVAIGHGSTLAPDVAKTEQAAAMLGATAHAVGACRRIFDTGVGQPIPRMSMLTIVINDQFGASGAIACGGGVTQTNIAAFYPCSYAGNGDGLRGARVAQIGQLAETEQLRVELEISRGHESNAGKITCPMTLDDALRIIEPVLPAYRLPSTLVHRLLSICTRIHSGWQLERPIDLFQTLWTLLGSASVRSLLDGPLAETSSLARLVEHRIITDKKQLLYLYPAALPSVDTLLNSCVGHERDALIVKLRTLMAQRPTLFATAAQTIATRRITAETHVQGIFDELLPCVELGIATPTLVELASSTVDPRQLALLQQALRKTGEKAFSNDALQLTDIAAFFVDACPRDVVASLRNVGLSASLQLGREILYYLYRPVTMDYATFCVMLDRLSDRTEDWAMWGIGGHGEFWNGTLQCYEYWIDRDVGRIGKIRLYASKNVGSFFAKSTAGICTDTNVELFNRPDHYHLNIVDADDGRVAGNVQLYIGDGVRGRFLLVRGINPIQGFCVNQGVDMLVRCILHAVCDMAAFGGFSEVRLCEQNGLWNADSSRAEVRTCLKRMFAGVALEPMERPLHLYNYYDRAINVCAYYRIWECNPHQPESRVPTEGIIQ